jgi:hypothetical protein
MYFANGMQERLPIAYGREVRECWSRDGAPLGTTNSVIAWNFQPPNFSVPRKLFRTTWVNPHPAVELVMISYQSTLSPSGPFLLAVTIEP